MEATILIGIDGGLTSPAVSIYRDGVLFLKDVRSKRAPVTKRPRDSNMSFLIRRTLGMADAVREFIQPADTGQAVTIVFEYPFTPGLRSAKSIATTGVATGVVMGQIMQYYSEHMTNFEVRGVMPATWQKKHPKEGILELLTDLSDPDLITDDMLSATGVLLWATDGDMPIDRVVVS